MNGDESEEDQGGTKEGKSADEQATTPEGDEPEEETEAGE